MALAECPQSAVISIHQKCSKEVVTQKQGHGQPRLINGHSIQFSFTYLACYNPNSPETPRAADGQLGKEEEEEGESRKDQ